MNWQADIAAEFARQRKAADAGVVEEMAQHAEAAYEAARADGVPTPDAEASVRALIRSWCGATSGPRRFERTPLVEASPGTSIFSGLALDVRLAFRLVRRQPGFASVSIVMIA